MKLTADSRMELLTALEFLSGFTNPGFASLTKLEFEYKTDFVDHFSPYRNGPAMRRYTRMCSGGFPLNISGTMMFGLSEPPELGALRQPIENKELFEEFAGVAKEFSEETDFAAFFEAHERTFAAVEKAARAEIKDRDVVQQVEEYYGARLDSYTVLLTPLFRQGGNGFRITQKDRGYDGYAIIGPTDVNNSLPYFGAQEQVPTLWHEFGHHFVEPLSERYAGELERRFSRFRFSAWGYAGWWNMINEYIIRAVSSRIYMRRNGDERVLRWMKDEEKGGFTCMTGLYRSLEAYESDREKYPMFADFYPEVTKKLEELLSKQQ